MKDDIPPVNLRGFLIYLACLFVAAALGALIAWVQL